MKENWRSNIGEFREGLEGSEGFGAKARERGWNVRLSWLTKGGLTGGGGSV
jgi:hypothetical protein